MHQTLPSVRSPATTRTKFSIRRAFPLDQQAFAIGYVGEYLDRALARSALAAGHATQAGFKPIVPRHAVGGTPASYAQQVIDNSIAVLGWITTTDGLIAEWAS
jgi:hypothetical protein